MFDRIIHTLLLHFTETKIKILDARLNIPSISHQTHSCVILSIFLSNEHICYGISITGLKPIHASGHTFYTPWKRSKTSGFLFSGGIEKNQWHEMG